MVWCPGSGVVLDCIISFSLLLTYFVNVSVLWIFLKVPWVGLQCVIVEFPYHNHLLFYCLLIF